MPENNVPLVETDRLRLRGHRLEDYPACVAMWSEPVVTQFIGGKPSTPQQTWMRLMGYIGHWSLMHYGYWVVEEKSSGKFIGEVGFADFNRDVADSMRGVPELGWALAPFAHGKGYATEATRAALTWGDKHLPSRRTVCMIHVDNLASIRVAEKIGYEIFERAEFAGTPTLFLERNART